jgi:molecular chaperone GrpE
MSDEQKSAEPTSAEGSNSGPGVATELEDPLTVELRELKARLAQVEAQAGEYKDQWLRATADYKNFKRRTDIERSELIRSASSALLLKMLPVMDDFERSMANIPPEVAESAWWGGTQLIAQKLRTVLESEGVNAIAALGTDFDPNLHEAVLYEDADGQDGKVIAELQRGYKLGDRVLRPSMVKVGRG